MSSELYNEGAKSAKWSDIYCKSLTCGTISADTPKFPYIQAVKTLQVIPTGVTTEINNYDSVSGSLAGNFDTISGVFTPTISGYYMITATHNFNIGAGNANVVICTITCGTSISQESHDDYVGGALVPTVSGLMWCDANEPCYYSVLQTITANLNISFINFSIVLLTS
jgi:hypothetical protein